MAHCLYAYEVYDDAGPNVADASIGSGSLRFYYTPAGAVPEPGSYALMALGLLAVGTVARRRRD